MTPTDTAKLCVLDALDLCRLIDQDYYPEVIEDKVKYVRDALGQIEQSERADVIASIRAQLADQENGARTCAMIGVDAPARAGDDTGWVADGVLVEMIEGLSDNGASADAIASMFDLLALKTPTEHIVYRRLLRERLELGTGDFDAALGDARKRRRAQDERDGRPPEDTTPKVFTLPEVMALLAEIRTEQATFWAKVAGDESLKPPKTKEDTWLVINKCGALTEIEMQAVISEIERTPELLKKSRAIILKLWAKAQRTLSRIIKPKATDDIIADAYKQAFENRRMFTRSRWYKWLEAGVWSDECEAKDEIWQQMIAMKDSDVTPTSNKRRSVEEYLQGGSMMGVPESAVDSRPDLLNLENGVLDITTREMLPNSYDFYLTTQLPFNHDNDAECPRWLEFLDQVLVDRDGKPCRDTIHFMQQAFGYSLTAWTKYEVSFWLQGDGANGKSTLLRILAQVNGSAAMSLNLGMLERDMYQLANLSGVRVVMCSESPVGLKVADAVIKGLVSGDPMQVRLPYAKPFQLYPICKVWWAMNNPPRVADTSDGFWRRVKVVPFRASFGLNGKKSADVNLVNKLKEELPGILNWALEGLRDLEAEGWVASSSITEATDAYRESNDVERAFIEACCVEGSACKVGGKQLYDAYKDWCMETGHRHKSMTRIASDWVRIGFEKKRTGNGVWYYGVGLSSEQLPEIPM